MGILLRELEDRTWRMNATIAGALVTLGDIS
jgi:hypothetical protein